MRVRYPDWGFFVLLGLIGGSYVLLVVLMLAADLFYTEPSDFIESLQRPEIQYAVKLTMISCTIAAIMSLWVATPLGYLLSRFRFPGRWLVDTLIDIPVVLPPLVLGLSLLILFHLDIGGWQLERWLQETIRFTWPDWLYDMEWFKSRFNREFKFAVTYRVPAVILAQFSVAAAFAVRTMRVTFDQISPRAEDVARTLGCSRSQAFLQIALPQSSRGMMAAFTIAWARSLGEFGPILVFAGATRMRTEVLSTTVFLELSIGNLEAAVAISLIMVAMAMLVLVVLRMLGTEMRS